MLKRSLRGTVNPAKWALCLCGVAALVVTAMLATPLARLPELTSVSNAARAVVRRDLPAVDVSQAAMERS